MEIKDVIEIWIICNIVRNHNSKYEFVSHLLLWLFGLNFVIFQFCAAAALSSIGFCVSWGGGGDGGLTGGLLSRRS